MSTAFYRYWLPVSLGLHLLLVFVFSLIRLFPAEIENFFQGEFIPVIVSGGDEPAPDPALLEPDPLPDPAAPQKAISQPVGVPDPKYPGGVDPKEGSVPLPGGGGGESRGTGPDTNRQTAPPPLLSGRTGEWKAPPGALGGTGTRGTDVGEEGVSYGVAAKGGPVRGTSKSAGELNQNGMVTLLVQVASDGSISTPQITASSGEDRLDAIALQLVRQWTFAPGMKDGAPAGGSVRMRVTFTHGQYLVEEVR